MLSESYSKDRSYKEVVLYSGQYGNCAFGPTHCFIKKKNKLSESMHVQSGYFDLILTF